MTTPMRYFLPLFVVATLGCPQSVDVFQSPDGAAGDAGRPDARVGGDAGPDRDASTRDASRPPVDAGPGNFFTLEPATTDFFVSHERCDVGEGSAVVFDIMLHWFDSCDTPGPVEAVVTGDRITVSGYVWREHGRTDCMGVGAAVPRTVVVEGLTMGTYTLENTGETVEVGGAPPPITCIDPMPAGSTCLASCDCQGDLVCAGVQGEGFCGMTCQRPCGIDGSNVGYDGVVCPFGDACASTGGVLACSSRALDACTPGSCRDGMRCETDADFLSYCTWDTTIAGSTRHSCTGNDDCGPGHDCVQSPTGARSCEVRCVTPNMVCPGPGPHACAPTATIGDARWVCEFLGE